MSDELTNLREENDNMINETVMLKAKVNRLERENEQLKESHIKHITNMENYYKDRRAFCSRGKRRNIPTRAIRGL